MILQALNYIYIYIYRFTDLYTYTQSGFLAFRLCINWASPFGGGVLITRLVT